MVLGLVLAGWLLLQLFVVELFTVSAASMVPTLQPGDRVLVLRPTLDRAVQRGDVLVLDARGTFVPGRPVTGALAGTPLAPAPDDAFVVKRVVGLPGERVTCCDPDGRITVDGEPLDEPYLPDVEPSDQPFDVVVPAGRLWVLGDNRPRSEDSRSHLGSPGGGTLAVSNVVGRVVAVF